MTSGFASSRCRDEPARPAPRPTASADLSRAVWACLPFAARMPCTLRRVQDMVDSDAAGRHCPPEETAR
jgi:hypothetical protein